MNINELPPELLVNIFQYLGQAISFYNVAVAVVIVPRSRGAED
jgi:hypothetical protein